MIRKQVAMFEFKNSSTLAEFIYLNSFVIGNKVHLLLYEKLNNRMLLIPLNEYVQKNYKLKI